MVPDERLPGVAGDRITAPDREGLERRRRGLEEAGESFVVVGGD